MCFRGRGTAVAIINSTRARNSTSAFGFGGALFVSGGFIVNATIADNESDTGGQALNASSALALHNTSLDNNVFIDPSCAVALLPQDLAGDLRLGGFRR